MDFVKFYRNNETFVTRVDERIERIVASVHRLAPGSVLDIGCGAGHLLVRLQRLDRLKETRFAAIDVYAAMPMAKVNYAVGDITAGLPFRLGLFECVILGEVIEHVPHPDFVLREIHRVLQRDGFLVISTPNLLSWANRILVVVGIQPLYTETSSEVKLGRYFKFLGQGRKTEGHLKIFGAQALQEILERAGFTVVEKQGVPFYFPQPIAALDRLFNHWVPLASGLLYIARRSSA